MIVRLPDKATKECEDAYRNSQLVQTFLGDVPPDWHLQAFQQSLTLDVGAGFFDLLCNPPERFKKDTLFTAWIPVFMPVEIHRSHDGLSINFH